MKDLIIKRKVTNSLYQKSFDNSGATTYLVDACEPTTMQFYMNEKTNVCGKNI